MPEVLEHRMLQAVVKPDHGKLAGLGDVADHPYALLRDGTRALIAGWDAGSHKVKAEQLESDIAAGTAPLIVASDTVVANLNADKLDGSHASAFAASSHNHDASDINAGILVHERGGLEADVSAYAGLVKISGGATSAAPIGIADDNVVEMDDDDAADNDYAKFTANGLEGRSYTEVRSDINVADGADVTGDNAPKAHKDSHAPGASDGLDVATPTDIGTANAEGNGTAFVRDNHVHAIPTEWRTRSFLVEVPTPADDDEFIVHWFPHASTLVQVRVLCKAATSITFDLTERGYDTPGSGGVDISASPITATTTPADVTMNNTGMAANTVLVYHSSAKSGTPEKGWIFGKYTIN